MFDVAQWDESSVVSCVLQWTWWKPYRSSGRWSWPEGPTCVTEPWLFMKWSHPTAPHMFVMSAFQVAAASEVSRYFRQSDCSKVEKRDTFVFNWTSMCLGDTFHAVQFSYQLQWVFWVYLCVWIWRYIFPSLCGSSVQQRRRRGAALPRLPWWTLFLMSIPLVGSQTTSLRRAWVRRWPPSTWAAAHTAKHVKHAAQLTLMSIQICDRKHVDWETAFKLLPWGLQHVYRLIRHCRCLMRMHNAKGGLVL